MTIPRWTPDQILQHTRLPGAPNIYVLGCMERRRVTIGSQQVRAVNLIHAIATNHYRHWQLGDGWHDGNYPGWKERVLVVGGSAGGLTAAAHAAFRGATVTLVEMKDRLMPNLVDSVRLLHPRVYEWGSPQPFEVTATPDYWKGGRVGIPLLDWTADEAKKVRESLLAEWDGWQQLYKIDVRTYEVPPYGGADWPLLLKSEKFDHVILAVGFGQERRMPHPDWVDCAAKSYWEPDNLERRSGNILICGNGDGALTDLFRSCLRGFGQDRLVPVLEKVDWDRALEQRVLAIETALESHPDSADAEYEMARAYLSMRAPALDAWTANSLRDDIRVWLSVRPTHGFSKESAFARAAFPLNRLLLASLLRVAEHSCFRRLDIIYTKGNLPVVPPGDGMHHLIFRAGVDFKPVQRLLPHAAKGLDDLERRNRDKSEGDITRQPLWPFFGEAIDPTRLPSAQAFIPALKGSSDNVAVEFFRNVHTFEPISEAFDSVFQAAADTAFSDQDASGYFKGVMRFYMLAFDRILLTDAQVWDGTFMLRLPQTWRSLSPYERKIIKTKFEIRERPHHGFAHARDAFFLRKVDGRLKAKAFLSSALGDEVSEKFRAWSETEEAFLPDGHKASAESILRWFEVRHPHLGSTIQPVLESWAAFDAISATLFARREWPSPRRTRFWNVGLQLETPGRFHGSLTPMARKILENAFHEQQKESERSHLHEYLRKQATQVDDGDRLMEEIAQIKDWFDRAYNRMTVKNQGANVFSALLLGDAPGAAESGSLQKADVSILKLGEMESEGFEALHRRWEEIKSKEATDRIKKPITERFWRSLFDELAKALSPIKEANELKIKPGHQSERVVRKMAKYSSIVNFRIGWVGDLEYGQPGEQAARVMKTEGEADDSGDAPGESRTEAFPQNPLGLA